MNYEEMSDFEINKAVASIAINGASEFWQDVPSKQAVSVFNKEGISLAIVDYCNSWADAGPIIEENRISIIFDYSSDMVNAEHETTDFYYDYYDENPLRCAMIVFLKMKEQENG